MRASPIGAPLKQQTGQTHMTTVGARLASPDLVERRWPVKNAGDTSVAPTSAPASGSYAFALKQQKGS